MPPIYQPESTDPKRDVAPLTKGPCQVDQAVNDLFEATGSLLSLCDALRARLAPVMRESEPVSEDALVQAKPDGSSPLVRVLRERAGVLRAIACDLDEIIGRLDL